MDKDEHGYPLAPRKCAEHLWFYEERKGLSVCSAGNETVLVPWRRIEAAVDNHRRAKAARKRKRS